jgi:enamine deaminase RidA (YjgF/YER057c/UK114 family)
MSAELRLRRLGVKLPEPPEPAGLYDAVVRTGNLLYVSGMLPLRDGVLVRRGKLGVNVTPDEGFEAAGVCALNALAAVRREIGTLDLIKRAVRVTGYVAAGPGFIAHPHVINGASQVLIDVLDDAGRHARSAIGVAELPMEAPVEVEFIFEVESE